MNGYKLTRQADRNLIDIYLYTAGQFGIRQADRYLDGLRSAFELLVAHPRLGRTADQIRPGVRRHEHAEHVIFYRLTSEFILIVGVLHRKMRPDLDLED